MPRQGRLEYQRLIVGYHGCDRETFERVLLGPDESLDPSDNDYDWLGKGIYFWEFAPRRALEFAREKKNRGGINDPAVLGAYIHLGRCFDLTDVEHTHQLKDAFDRFKEAWKLAGRKIPKNHPADQKDNDLLLRERDCAVLNFYMSQMDMDAESAYRYQSVRGVFQEGDAAFEGSKIRKKSHVQIAVRDPACIVGYFRPSSFSEQGGTS